MKYEEAIKLKPGTPILIRSKIVSVDKTGDVVYETHAHGQEYEVMRARTDCQYVDIQTPEQKFDICRRFKKGDIVKTVERYGRKVPDAVDVYGYEVPDGPENKEWVVEEAETFGMVEVLCKIRGEFYQHKLPFFHLELVTPVEDLEPYDVLETDTIDGFDIMCDGLCVMTFPYGSKENGYYYNERTAKEAAENEARRLNAEWRKEHE